MLVTSYRTYLNVHTFYAITSKFDKSSFLRFHANKGFYLDVKITQLQKEERRITDKYLIIDIFLKVACTFEKLVTQQTFYPSLPLQTLFFSI